MRSSIILTQHRPHEVMHAQFYLTIFATSLDSCTCKFGAIFDVGGMDAAVSFNAVYMMWLLLGYGDGATWVRSSHGIFALRVFGILHGAVCVVAYTVHDAVDLIFVTSILGATGLAAVHAVVHRNSADRPRPAILVGAAACVAAGLAVWYNEWKYHRCLWSRSAPVQPHALWHLCTASALLLGYAYARTMGVSSWAATRQVLFLEACDATEEYISATIIQQFPKVSTEEYISETIIQQLPKVSSTGNVHIVVSKPHGVRNFEFSL